MVINQYEEHSLNDKEKEEMFNTYKEWFDEKGFDVHLDSVKFVRFHWRVYATIKTEEETKTHTFFMTPDSLSMFMGIGKPLGVIMRPIKEENVFDKMRAAINHEDNI